MSMRHGGGWEGWGFGWGCGRGRVSYRGASRRSPSQARWHKVGPTLLCKPLRPQSRAESGLEKSKAELRRRRAGERAAQCESCSVPPRGKLHIKRGNHAGWALSSPSAVRWSQKLAKKDPEKTGWTSCKGQDIRRTIISIQSHFSNLYLMPCTIVHMYKHQPDYIKV